MRYCAASSEPGRTGPDWTGRARSGRAARWWWQHRLYNSPRKIFGRLGPSRCQANVVSLLPVARPAQHAGRSALNATRQSSSWSNWRRPISLTAGTSDVSGCCKKKLRRSYGTDNVHHPATRMMPWCTLAMTKITYNLLIYNLYIYIYIYIT